MKFKLIEDKNEKRYSIQSIDAWNSKEEIESTDDFVYALYKTFETFDPEDYEETVIIKDNIDNKYMDFDELEDAAKDYFKYLKRKEQVCAFGRSDYAEMDDLEEILERVFGVSFESDYYDEALEQGDDQKAKELQSKLDQLDRDWDKADASGQPTKPISDEIEATQKQLDETFEVEPILNNIDIFIKEHPINIDEFKTVEEFEAFIANDLLNKEINALTNEELYAIETVYERLSDAMDKDKELAENRSDWNKYEKSANQLKDMADEAKKKQKGLGAFVKLDAGDVEHNVAAFNNATTINTGEGMIGESAETKEINIREKLIEKDIANGDGFGTLTNLYDAVEYKLTLDDKKQIIDYIVINNYNAIERFLESKLINIDGQFDLED